MRATVRLVSAAILLVATSMGCTIRYSQSLVGEIARVSTTPIANSDTGIEVGIGPVQPAGSGGSAVIAFSEPMAAQELLTVPCEVALAQVDYRGKWYSIYYITGNFPETEVVAYCVP